MRMIHQLAPVGYLNLFSYHEWAKGNSLLAATNDPSSNLLRRRTAELGITSAVDKVSVTSFDQFKDQFLNDQTGAETVGLAFRGQAGDWPLQTRLKRFWLEFERNGCGPIPDWRKPSNWEITFPQGIMDTHLFQEGRVLPPARDQLWAILQHYGAPTHLLDWTLSLDVALFFAFETAPVKDSTYAYVHMVDIGKMHEMNERLVDYDSKTSRGGSTDQDYTRHRDSWTFVWPKHFGDIRFAAQQGLFAIQQFMHPDDMIPLDEFLTQHDVGFNGAIVAGPGTLLSVRIPASERPAVMEYLDERGMSRESLFPDWSGICAAAVSQYRNYLLDPNWQMGCAMGVDCAREVCARHSSSEAEKGSGSREREGDNV